MKSPKGKVSFYRVIAGETGDKSKAKEIAAKITRKEEIKPTIFSQ